MKNRRAQDEGDDETTEQDSDRLASNEVKSLRAMIFLSIRIAKRLAGTTIRRRPSRDNDLRESGLTVKIEGRCEHIGPDGVMGGRGRRW